MYLIHLAEADEALLGGDFLRARLELEACPPGQRGWEWTLLETRMKATVPLALPGCQTPSFARDGKRLIAAGAAGGPDENKVLIWDAESGQLLEKLEHDSQLFNAALSPDETRLAGGAADGGLTLWNLETRKKLWTVREHTNRFDGIAYSPDGRWIATANMDRTLKVLAAADGAVKFALGFDHTVRGVSFSPDSRWLAANFNSGPEPPGCGQRGHGEGGAASRARGRRGAGLQPGRTVDRHRRPGGRDQPLEAGRSGMG